MKSIYLKYLLICISFLCLVEVYGQAPGLHGRKLSVSIGGGLNSSFIKIPPAYQIKDNKEVSYLPPKLFFNLEYAVNQRTTVQGGISFYPVPNSVYAFRNESFAGPNRNQTLLIDSITLNTNMYSLNVGFRRYRSFTHYGRFIDLSFSGNYFNSVIYPTVYRYETIDGSVTRHESEKLEPGRQWTYNFAISLGLGKKIVLNNYKTLEFGARSYLFYATQRKILAINNFREELDRTVDVVVYKRAQESHVLELFINIGLLR